MQTPALVLAPWTADAGFFDREAGATAYTWLADQRTLDDILLSRRFDVGVGRLGIVFLVLIVRVHSNEPANVVNSRVNFSPDRHAATQENVYII